MAQLAIKGHATRGSEVIALLEMLGGKNEGNNCVTDDTLWYCIDGLDEISNCRNYNGEFKNLTLEQFQSRFPYKIGDKVKYNGWPCTVQGMEWSTIDDEVLYTVQGIDFCKCVYAVDLVSDKEDSPLVSIPDKMQKIVSSGTISRKQAIKFSEESPDETELVLGNDFEVVNRDDKLLVVRKNITYPKTYHECWKILGAGEEEVLFDGATASEDVLFDSFIKLIRCRDAYWKIAGDWKPNYSNSGQHTHTIEVVNDKVGFYDGSNCNRILAFPTAEMRDAFYENFKELIEDCKELL